MRTKLLQNRLRRSPGTDAVNEIHAAELVFLARRDSVALVGFRQHAESSCYIQGQLAGTELPAPVARCRPRLIRPRLAAQREKVLHGNDRRISNRCQHGANELPMHGASVETQIASGVVPLASDVVVGPRAVTGAASPPSDRRIVVMRSGINDEIAWIVMRAKIGRLRIGAKRELQDRHAGKAELMTERFDLRA